MTADTKNQIINSRLLILQSKRLMLNSLLRRLDSGAPGDLHARVDAMRAQTELAQHAYRTSVLAWGSAAESDYWVIAYSRLIEMGNALAAQLRGATAELPLSERYAVSADVELLEEIVASWTASLRTVMAAAVA